MSQDKFIKSRAAVAWGPNQPLKMEEVDVMLPRKGEVLVRIVASGVCHTDAFTLSGDDPEGVFRRSSAMKAVVSLKWLVKASPAWKWAITSFHSTRPNVANVSSVNQAKPTCVALCVPLRAKA